MSSETHNSKFKNIQRQSKCMFMNQTASNSKVESTLTWTKLLTNWLNNKPNNTIQLWNLNENQVIKNPEFQLHEQEHFFDHWQAKTTGSLLRPSYGLFRLSCSGCWGQPYLSLGIGLVLAAWAVPYPDLEKPWSNPCSYLQLKVDFGGASPFHFDPHWDHQHESVRLGSVLRLRIFTWQEITSSGPGHLVGKCFASATCLVQWPETVPEQASNACDSEPELQAESGLPALQETVSAVCVLKPKPWSTGNRQGTKQVRTLHVGNKSDSWNSLTQVSVCNCLRKGGPSTFSWRNQFHRQKLLTKLIWTFRLNPCFLFWFEIPIPAP